MDDCGIADTNDPRVRILWERDGKTVRFALDVAPEPEPRLSLELPPTAHS
jgi:hypothetical protein